MSDSRFLAELRRRWNVVRSTADAGMATAEYAIATLATVVEQKHT